MEIKTCEEYVLAELEQKKSEIQALTTDKELLLAQTDWLKRTIDVMSEKLLALQNALKNMREEDGTYFLIDTPIRDIDASTKAVLDTFVEENLDGLISG